MKIITNHITEREIEITIPFFRKDNSYNCLKYFAVLDEKTCIDIFDSGERTSVAVDSLDRLKLEVAKNYETLTPITEQEFLTAHSKALKRLSLVPELVDDIPTPLFSGKSDKADPDYPLLNIWD